MGRRLVLLSLALLLAAGGTVAVHAYASSADARALAGQEVVEVLVATERVDTGATAAEVGEHVQLVRLARAAAPAAGLRDLDGVGEDVLATDLHPGQALVPGMFEPASARRPDSPLPIPDGQLAVSVALGDPMRVAGFVQPGTEVAVFGTYEADVELGLDDGAAPDLHGPSVTTRLVLPRALVLAVATTPLGAEPAEEAAEGSGEDGALSAAEASGTTLSVTLAVSQADAERLIQVAQAGNPYLALLTPTSETAPSAGTDNRALLG